jgi:excisionase family DNA binding protein
MNLADAIRRAAQASGQLDHATWGPAAKQASAQGEQADPGVVGMRSPSPQHNLASDEEIEVLSLRNGELVGHGDCLGGQAVGTQAVRLELFLGPEQVSMLMRSVVAAQHTVLTLREAAQFLRIPGTHLKQLAEDSAVPGFKVDGKWRFSRATLESWLTDQTQQQQSAS